MWLLSSLGTYYHNLPLHKARRLSVFKCAYHRFKLSAASHIEATAVRAFVPLTCVVISLQPLMTPLSTPQRGGGKVQPWTQGGAPVGRDLVSFLVLFRKKRPQSLETAHSCRITAQGKNRKRPYSEEGSGGLADVWSAIFSCRSFVSDLCPASK